MVAAPKGSKLIFTVLLHRHSPERFQELRLRRLNSMYSSPRTRERYRDEFDSQFSPIYRYNDVAGYAEIYWDAGTRVLIDLFFRGDLRTKYGKAVACGRRGQISASQFYLYLHCLEAGGIPHLSCSEALKREAIIDGLQRVRAVAADMGCVIDLTHEETLLSAIDVRYLFSR